MATLKSKASRLRKKVKTSRTRKSQGPTINSYGPANGGGYDGLHGHPVGYCGSAPIIDKKPTPYDKVKQIDFDVQVVKECLRYHRREIADAEAQLSSLLEQQELALDSLASDIRNHR